MRLHAKLQSERPIAGVLNKPIIENHRSLGYADVRLHVSDLMKVDRQRGFCEREHVIRKLFRPTVISGALKPSLKLLYDLGNALHDTARNQWMEHNGTGRRRVLARWSCPCGHTKHVGVAPELANVCKRCRLRPLVFDEYEVYSKRYSTVAHPDFIIVKGKGVLERGYFDKSKDMIRIVEIKGLSREDIDWYRLDGPLGEHTVQGSFYYWLMRAEGYRVDPLVSYLYGERNLKTTLFTGEPWKEFEVEASPLPRIKKFLDKADRVVDLVARRVVPERKLCDSVTCTRAGNCSVASLCFSMRQDEHKQIVPRPAKKAAGHTPPPFIVGQRPALSVRGDRPVVKRYRLRLD